MNARAKRAVALLAAAAMLAGSLVATSYGTPEVVISLHPCRAHKEKLERDGMLGLRSWRVKCEVARQVAYRVRGGNTSPRGFACDVGEGGNRFPVKCRKGPKPLPKLVFFTLEG